MRILGMPKGLAALVLQAVEAEGTTEAAVSVCSLSVWRRQPLLRQRQRQLRHR
jgi:hypothetical protein